MHHTQTKLHALRREYRKARADGRHTRAKRVKNLARMYSIYNGLSPAPRLIGLPPDGPTRSTPRAITTNTPSC